MAKPAPLASEELYTRCNPDHFSFTTTDELERLGGALGQDKATEALRFGVGMQASGYNVFLLGESKPDMRELTRHVIENEAVVRPPPQDWCYVKQFNANHKPMAIALPKGQGHRFREDMNQFIEDLRSMLPGVFSSDEYQGRLARLAERFANAQRQDLDAMRQEAEAMNMVMLSTPNGFAFAPAKDGKVLEQEAFQALGPEQQKQIEQTINELNDKLLERMRGIPMRQQELAREQRALIREFTETTVVSLVRQLRRHYQTQEQTQEQTHEQTHERVLGYLDAVRDDVLEHSATILALDGEPGASRPPSAQRELKFYDRYRVNLLVHHDEQSPGPLVVFESNPSLENLVGRIERSGEFADGAVDFTMIHGGALHQANGGYLVVDSEALLTKPFAWDALKRALQDKRICVESMSNYLGLGYTVSLDPEPIPLDVKVILLGSRMMYLLLSQLDPEFGWLFKVPADFTDTLQRSAANEQSYARLIASIAHAKALKPLTASAVMRTIEHASRLIEDREKLAASTGPIVEVMQEGNFIATAEGAGVIDRQHIQAAIDRQARRLDRIQTELRAAIRRGAIAINVDGAATGVINGLSVLRLGSIQFGQPARISATCRLGRGEVLDIERAAKLGGNLHTKGVMIVSSFVSTRYARQAPLSLHINLVFEQSYGGVDGDSASIAEVVVILSAISELPILQSLAVTGSMDQHGHVQAIGGVNHKIEGFFDVCTEIGMTGQQGVIIPKANTPNLMLRPDVSETVAEGRFHVYAVDHIDEVIELMFAREAGSPAADGGFPKDSVNQLVTEQLERYAALARQHARPPGGQPKQPDVEGGEND